MRDTSTLQGYYFILFFLFIKKKKKKKKLGSKLLQIIIFGKLNRLSLNDTSLLGDLDREMKVTPLTSKTPHSSSHIPTLSFVSPSPVHFSPQHSSPYSKGEENQQV